jgi:HSP20 family protein
MSQLVRWDPFGSDFGRLARVFDRMFGSVPSEMGTRESLSQWDPAVDIFDKGNELLLQLEVPGMKKEDIQIRLENNVLTVQGERKRESEIKHEHYFRAERSYGAFSRSFTLPGTVNVDKIQAQYMDGVLTVTVPKAKEAQPRQIEVEVA